MASGQVQIGREFFTKIKNDYANWQWALIREFLQNCFDAPSCDEVLVTVVANGNNTTLTVRNNGAPMDEDTLVNKLLTLGGSGKNFDGENTGGFGVAKSLLYYTHPSYQIRTGKLSVSGSGAQYDIKKSANLNGTESMVEIDGDQVNTLINTVERFAAFTQWKGTLSLNGRKLTCDLKKGSRRRDLGWATIYTNRSFANVCIVRLNGQPMFTRFCRFEGAVIVELTGKAKDTLTSNRDSVRGDYASELSDLLTALAVDKRSALREQRAEYKRYMGEKLRQEAAAKPKKQEQGLDGLVDVAALAEMLEMAQGTGTSTESVSSTVTGGGVKLVVTSTEDVTQEATISLGHEFIVKNTTGMVTPEYHLPGKQFSNYSRQLVRVWAAILLKMYAIHGISGEFSIGFVLDEESVAEHEQGVYGKVYYINPIRVVCQRKQPNCRSFKARYTGVWSARFEILASAAHEFVHGAYGLKEHDENYAGKLTEIMARVFEHVKEFTPIFRQ